MAKKKRKPARPTGASKSSAIPLVLGAVAVAAVASIVYMALGARTGGAVLEPIDLVVEDNAALLEMARPVMQGDPNAPVELHVFNDFQCPACRDFATVVKPMQLAGYIEAGQLRVVYYDFPLRGHPHSFVVSRAARCAEEQGRFWEYHDLALARQPEWSPKPSVLSDLEGFARDLGLDGGAFSSCLRSDRYADVVTASQLLGDRVGVRGTPTVFVNGQPVAEWNRALPQVIEEHLGR